MNRQLFDIHKLYSHSFFKKLIKLTVLSAVLLLILHSAPVNPVSLSSSQNMSGHPESADSEFLQLTEKLLLSELSSDALTRNALLLYPENYSLEAAPVTLGHYSSERLRETGKYYAMLAKQLENTDKSALSLRNRLTYNQLLSQCRLNSILYDNVYLHEPLSPSKGAHVCLPVLFAEYNIDSVTDAVQYLELLSQLPAYFEELKTFETEKLQNNCFMEKSIALIISEQCRALDENALTDILLSGYEKSLYSLDMDKRTAYEYIRCCSDIILTQVAPAYKSLASYMDKAASLSKPGEIQTVKYDENLHFTSYLQLKTGSSMTIPEMKSALETLLYESMVTLCTADMDKLSEPVAECISTDAYEMLEILSDSMVKHFPVCNTLNYTVKKLPEALGSRLGVAMYMLPPLDAPSENIIYINNAFSNNEALFTTLAHEGFPGHMYMSAHNRQQNLDPYSIISSPLGYEEGWATYCEVFSYSCLYPDQKTSDFYSANMLANLCIHSLIDLGAGYYGWKLTDCIDFLKPYGIPEESAKEIYLTVLGDAGLYIPYSIGYIEWCRLRNTAEELWKDSFDPLTFHTFMLKLGPADFESLRECISSISVSTVK